MQFMTLIKLLHVLAQGCHPQELQQGTKFWCSWIRASKHNYMLYTWNLLSSSDKNDYGITFL